MTTLRDIRFTGFDFRTEPTGDLATVDGLESFRQVLHHWLLTEPAPARAELVDEEVERRRVYASADERAAGYDAPGGERLGACLPWDPAWGAGIKSYLNRPMTGALLEEIRGRLLAGLSGLEGVKRVLSLRLSHGGDVLTIAWQIESDLGPINDVTRLTLS